MNFFIIYFKNRMNLQNLWALISPTKICLQNKHVSFVINIMFIFVDAPMLQSSFAPIFVDVHHIY